MIAVATSFAGSDGAWGQAQGGTGADKGPGSAEGLVAPATAPAAPMPAQSNMPAEADMTPTAALAVSLTPITALTSATPVVVELFTSEGCTSCPPADENLGKYVGQRSILPLSYHVDYWDYIGWPDRNADPAFSARQRGYGDALGHAMVYTPQVIIAGTSDSLGTDPTALAIALADGRHVARMTAIRMMRDDSGNVLLDLPQANLPSPVTLWLLTYRHKVETTVAAGENAGRDLVSYNVVRSLRKLGQWTGKAETLPVTLAPLPAGESAPDAVAVIANLQEHGPVIAATAIRYQDFAP
ncbi:DUF1223 domain-containing protein [Dongia soli]|uniref:DUF1223 domain-containing protein n=1 Tax=Dongia soli TaxID=600628 RepID=A0ABU5E6S7_9PROT|nr:DUF1223 domain-containing protein [Dongia soli]MDY0881849.1 DUF1223 domain-containing protein [Dongia soli]